MAQSRLERLGSIVKRTEGLLKSGAMKWENRPIWYDVYVAFPPIDEPNLDKQVKPNEKLRPIFYPEDRVRAVVDRFYEIADKRGKNLDFNDVFAETIRSMEADGIPFSRWRNDKSIESTAFEDTTSNHDLEDKDSGPDESRLDLGSTKRRS